MTFKGRRARWWGWWWQ